MSDTTCIIGDIHGCSRALSELLALVGNRADRFVFLGDYIDRGPDAKGAVDRVLAFRKTHPQTVALMGNHEVMLLDYLEGYDDSMFLKVGGQETLASYGISPKMGPDQARQLIPAEHLAFFSTLPLLWEDQHGIYVHAGLEPGVHLSRQVSACCLWVRDDFIRSKHQFGKTVVFGHTPFKKPLVQDNKIGIDTGAVYGGELTALLLPHKEIISVAGEKKSDVPVCSADSEGLVQERTGGFGLSKLFRFFR